MTMSVHDALEAWQLGEIPIERAKELTGAVDIDELHELCVACHVKIVKHTPIMSISTDIIGADDRRSGPGSMPRDSAF